MEFSSIKLNATNKGARGFTAHTGDHGAVWLFQDPEDRIPNNPGITIGFRAFGLATGGLDRAERHFRACMDAFGIPYVETQLRVARADFAVDFLAPWFEPNRECLVVPPGTKVTEYTGVDDTATTSSGARVTGLRAGAIANRQIAIYDKRAEVIQSNKLGWLTIWNAAREAVGKPPLDFTDRNTSQVWRFELRLGSKQLRNRFELRSWQDIRDTIGDAFTDAIKRIRYFYPTHDRNRARWPAHELWRSLEMVIGSDLQQNCCGVLPSDVIQANRTAKMRELDLDDRRRTMAGEALFNGLEYPIFNRVGSVEDCLFLDLGGKDWASVCIDANGWKIVKRGAVRFLRSRAMQALPAPVTGPADINLLRPFLNVSSETDFRMLVAWLLGCFQPKGPYPILILTGEQGSAKSTTAKVLRSLIDPANPMTRSAPQSEQDLVIAARHNHALAFDNLSHIKPNLADALCRIATGGGFGTRKLHTNSEEVLFDATRPVLMNGIPDLASRPDLADRSIIVSLPVIEETEREFEAEFWTRFNQAAPHILAVLLNATATALARLSTVTLTERPRMADFTKWVSAAEPALGWPEGAFSEAYAANRQSVDSAAIECNPVAEAIVSMIMDRGPFKGTATELTKALRSLYPQLTDDPLIFLRQHNKLSSELKRVQPLLRRQGITMSKARQGKTGQRAICIKHG
ncbi:hypothetical protein [Sulfitobacter sp.]|uniref:hypothetical protein n=1 Tax=Sulfitobacter sp. TaxID=1903071 RepID=UPI003002E687